VTVYNSDGFLGDTPNVIGSTQIAADTWKPNADGSYTIVIQQEQPADTSNWIKPPTGNFILALRMYSPQPQVYDPTDPQYPYKPPVIRRVSSATRPAPSTFLVTNLNDAGPNHPNDGTGGLFGVIHAAGDQGNQHGRHDHGSLMSASMMSSPTMSPPNGMLEQPMDAIFQEFDAVLSSLDSNLTAMNPQLSAFFAMLHSNLDALEATVLDRLDALESASLSMM
jgi:hypothetical protein